MKKPMLTLLHNINNNDKSNQDIIKNNNQVSNNDNAESECNIPELLSMKKSMNSSPCNSYLSNIFFQFEF